MCGGANQGEYNAQQQAQSEANQLSTAFTSQFAEQQGLLNNFLIPQLQGMVSNPQGFGATALADLNAQLVNTTAAQAASARQSAQQNFGSQNLAGLPSGVQQAVLSQINSAAGNQVAQGTTNIQLANEQEKLAQQQFGYQGLASAEQALGAAPQTGQLMLQGNQNAFGQSYQIAQQGNMWQNILGGVINGVVGAGMGLATGGLSTLMSGGGGGLGSVLFGQAGGGAGANGPNAIPVSTSSTPNQIA